MPLTHYRARWVPRDLAFTPSPPTWLLRVGPREVWDRDRLRERVVKPWQALEAQGGKVHMGVYRFTPHGVALAWMQDLLTLSKRAGWGWALWNLRGDFGVFDSRRPDVRYEFSRGAPTGSRNGGAASGVLTDSGKIRRRIGLDRGPLCLRHWRRAVRRWHL
jgi:endoglucanase